MRQFYFVRPIIGGEDSSAPALHMDKYHSPLALNVDVRAQAVVNRWGYAAADRSLGEYVHAIVLFQLSNGTRHTVYLTATNAAKREAAGTFSYITETYATGTVTNVTGAAVTGDSTAWNTSGVAAGDKFIVDTDHTAASEPDAEWATVETVGGATSITLAASYAGSGTGTYKLRQVYSVPDNERWASAVYNDVLYFGNGNTALQKWTGSGYASAVDATNAQKARYMIPYSERLVLADLDNAGVAARNAYRVQWSKNGDPTDWTDSTAGSADMVDSEDIITGLGKVGAYLIVFKQDSYIVGNESGIATEPIHFPIHRKGVGCIAPYSIIHLLGTNFWVGRDDFYYMDGDMARAVGGGPESKIKHRFFDIISETEIKRVVGCECYIRDQVMWFANTTAGHRCFAFNYKNNEWSEYSFANAMSYLGRGAT